MVTAQEPKQQWKVGLLTHSKLNLTKLNPDSSCLLRNRALKTDRARLFYSSRRGGTHTRGWFMWLHWLVINAVHFLWYELLLRCFDALTNEWRRITEYKNSHYRIVHHCIPLLKQVSSVPETNTICGPHFFRPSDLDLWPLTLKLLYQ